MLQFLRYAAVIGAEIKEESVQKIADSLAAGGESDPPSALVSPNSQNTLRAELRSKEVELDGLIKTLIDLPPPSQAESHGEDAKQALKSRIGELTNLVNILREQLVGPEDFSGS